MPPETKRFLVCTSSMSVLTAFLNQLLGLDDLFHEVLVAAATAGVGFLALRRPRHLSYPCGQIQLHDGWSRVHGVVVSEQRLEQKRVLLQGKMFRKARSNFNFILKDPSLAPVGAPQAVSRWRGRQVFWGRSHRPAGRRGRRHPRSRSASRSALRFRLRHGGHVWKG